MTWNRWTKTLAAGACALLTLSGAAAPRGRRGSTGTAAAPTGPAPSPAPSPAAGVVITREPPRLPTDTVGPLRDPRRDPNVDPRLYPLRNPNVVPGLSERRRRQGRRPPHRFWSDSVLTPQESAKARASAPSLTGPVKARWDVLLRSR